MFHNVPSPKSDNPPSSPPPKEDPPPQDNTASSPTSAPQSLGSVQALTPGSISGETVTCITQLSSVVGCSGGVCTRECGIHTTAVCKKPTALCLIHILLYSYPPSSTPSLICTLPHARPLLFVPSVIHALSRLYPPSSMPSLVCILPRSHPCEGLWIVVGVYLSIVTLLHVLQ